MDSLFARRSRRAAAVITARHRTRDGEIGGQASWSLGLFESKHNCASSAAQNNQRTVRKKQGARPLRAGRLPTESEPRAVASVTHISNCGELRSLAARGSDAAQSSV